MIPEAGTRDCEVGALFLGGVLIDGSWMDHGWWLGASSRGKQASHEEAGKSKGHGFDRKGMGMGAWRAAQWQFGARHSFLMAGSAAIRTVMNVEL
jgi:hypothetical protein